MSLFLVPPLFAQVVLLLTIGLWVYVLACVFSVCACVYDVNVSLTALSLVQLGGRSVPDPAHRVLLRPGSVGRAHGPPGRV